MERGGAFAAGSVLMVAVADDGVGPMPAIAELVSAAGGGGGERPKRSASSPGDAPASRAKPPRSNRQLVRPLERGDPHRNGSTMGGEVDTAPGPCARIAGRQEIRVIGRHRGHCGPPQNLHQGRMKTPGSPTNALEPSGRSVILIIRPISTLIRRVELPEGER